jgi:hypothetical protein
MLTQVQDALSSLAPTLSKRLYQGKARYLLEGYSKSEQTEAEQIIAWAMEATSEAVGELVRIHKGFRLRCVRKMPKREICQ